VSSTPGAIPPNPRDRTTYGARPWPQKEILVGREIMDVSFGSGRDDQHVCGDDSFA
jgi:hypothetical protein